MEDELIGGGSDGPLMLCVQFKSDAKGGGLVGGGGRGGGRGSKMPCHLPLVSLLGM